MLLHDLDLVLQHCQPCANLLDRTEVSAQVLQVLLHSDHESHHPRFQGVHLVVHQIASQVHGDVGHWRRRRRHRRQRRRRGWRQGRRRRRRRRRRGWRHRRCRRRRGGQRRRRRRRRQPRRPSAIVGRHRRQRSRKSGRPSGCGCCRKSGRPVCGARLPPRGLHRDGETRSARRQLPCSRHVLHPAERAAAKRVLVRGFPA